MGDEAEAQSEAKPAPRKFDDRKAIQEYGAVIAAEAAAHPEWPDLAHKAAVAKLLVRDSAGARALLEPVVAARPSYVEAARALAFAHLSAGDAIAGFDVLARLEEKVGKGFATALARGLFCAAAGKKGAARAALEAAVGLDPKSPFARYAHALACDDDDPGAGALPRAEADQEHLQEIGLAAHDRQILGNPARALVFREIAARCGEAGDEEGALRYMDISFSLDLDIAADAAGRADLALARGKVSDAVTGYRRAIAKDAGAVRVRVSLAYALVLSGERAGAQAALEEAVRLRPAWADLRRQLGEHLLEGGQSARAVEELSLAVELNPRYGAARFSLGRALLAAGDAAGAAVELGLACVGRAPDVAKEVALALHAKALLLAGDAEGAARSAAEAIAEDGTLPEPHLVLALVAERRGDSEGARIALAAYDERAGGEGAGEEEDEAAGLRGRLGGSAG